MPSINQEAVRRRALKFSYMESSTNEWLVRSVVGKCRKKVDVEQLAPGRGKGI